jgi:hypothetical protein
LAAITIGIMAWTIIAALRPARAAPRPTPQDL